MLVLKFIYKYKITLDLKERLGKPQPCCSALLMDAAFLTEPMTKLRGETRALQDPMAGWVVSRFAESCVGGLWHNLQVRVCTGLFRFQDISFTTPFSLERAAFSCSLLTGKVSSHPAPWLWGSIKSLLQSPRGEIRMRWEAPLLMQILGH